MRRTILLADDSVTIRKIVELTFSDTDIRVCSVASGQEALDRLSELRPDLVLADVVMPGPSGYELCRAIKTSDRPVPVLLLAGTFEPFDAGQARECGSDGHVTKPFDSRQLVFRVEQLLAHPEPTASRSEIAAQPAEDDLEAMFDDLAAPEVRWDDEAGLIDQPGASVSPHLGGRRVLARDDRAYDRRPRRDRAPRRGAIVRARPQGDRLGRGARSRRDHRAREDPRTGA